MKIALITDTHFGARNDSLPFNEYFYKFWEEIFFPLIDKKGIETIGPSIINFANFEGLQAHAKSVEKRIRRK